MSITKSFPRLWSLDAGVVMVVTDLHGDWDAYQRYRDRFLDLHSSGRVDHLILTGDLIHQSIPENPDYSLDMVLDCLALRSSLGDSVLYLSGNHELPHIYNFGLSKGGVEYTPAFEVAMSKQGNRETVLKLLYELPFFVRTAAGISITHAGASAALAAPANALKLFNFDHHQMIAAAKALVAKEDVASLRRAYVGLCRADSYDELVQKYLVTSGRDDPRHDDLLVGFFVTMDADFELLRESLFTRCEQHYGRRRYAKLLSDSLYNLSDGYAEQQLLLAGHTAVSGGHHVVAGRHLRLASAAHATPREKGQYVLFDAGKPMLDMETLLAGLQSVF